MVSCCPPRSPAPASTRPPLTRILAAVFLLLCAAGLAAYATTHAALYADDAYDYGDPND